MYETEIRKKINSVLGKFCCFIGTYGRDEIPDVKKRPAAIVINTALAHEEGEHWVALYINEDNECLYFDSFGLPPMHKEIQEYISRQSCSLKFNTVTLQTPASFSKTCGHYCIMFVVYLCRGHSFDELIALFSRNTFYNDLLVRDYLKM